MAYYKIELGTISGINQYGNTYHPTKFGACFKNRTIQELCRRTTNGRPGEELFGSLSQASRLSVPHRPRFVLTLSIYCK